MKPRNAWWVLVWGLAAGDAAALSLGSAHGRVLLGRPVDLVFEVLLDPGMELETACLTAELVSGDTLVGRGQVRVLPLPQGRAQGAAVRVQTSVLADEPVLTVAVSVGCAGKVTRTYTFLADLPDSVLPSTAPVAIPWQAPPAPFAAPERAAAVPAGAGEPGAALAPVPAKPVAAGAAEPSPAPRETASPSLVRPVAVPAEPPTRPAPQVPPAAAAAQASKPVAAVALRPRPAPRSRLVMEPLAVALAQTGRPGVPAPAPAASAAVSAASAPADAASAPLGAASAASEAGSAAAPASDVASAPQAAAPESLRILQLQEELARMRMQAASDHAAALALQQRVELLASERFHPGVVYGLLALVGLLLGWMAWQVVRFRTAFEQSTQAWSESVAQYGRKSEGAGG